MRKETKKRKGNKKDIKIKETRKTKDSKMPGNDAQVLNNLADSMANALSFEECDFRLGLEEGQTVMSPPRKKALASWTIYYNSTINPCAQIVNNFMPIVEQCEIVDTDN